MIEQLCDTRFMQKHGIRLSDISEKNASNIQTMLAKYTFLRNVFLEQHPESALKRPEPAEVQSAIRILDEKYKADYVNQLSNLIVKGWMPTQFTVLRFGMAEDCDKLKMLRNQSMHVMEDDFPAIKRVHDGIRDIKVRIGTAAEKALESIDGFLPSYSYLKSRNDELENLEILAKCPNVIKDIHIDLSFLVKFGIRKESSLPEQLQQIEKAYRELDARCTRMTGRRPYADELFASLKPKTQTPDNDKRETLYPEEPIQEQQAKGRGRKH